MKWECEELCGPVPQGNIHTGEDYFSNRKKKTLKVSGNGYEGKQQMKYHTFKKINEISVKAERVHGM